MGTVVQYVVLRSDLITQLKWPLGAVIAQACHACTACLHAFREDPYTQEYLASLDTMHKIVLEVGSCIAKSCQSLRWWLSQVYRDAHAIDAANTIGVYYGPIKGKVSFRTMEPAPFLLVNVRVTDLLRTFFFLTSSWSLPPSVSTFLFLPNIHSPLP